MFKPDLEKVEEPEIKLPTTLYHRKSREFEKNIYLCFIGYAKAVDSVDNYKSWEILKEREYKTTIPACLLRNLFEQVKEQRLKPDMYTK